MESRRWLAFGAGFGLLAGIVFATFEMVAARMMGDGFWMPLRMIGAIILGEQALEPSYSLAQAATVGMALHLALSTLYGAVFGAAVAIAPALRTLGTLVVSGTLYGLALWLVNFYVIAPTAFEWFQDASPAVQFVAHAFFYGALLGVSLGAVRRAAGEPHPHRVPRRA